MIVVVIGSDFVFAASTMYIATICMPHEQSVGGGLFQTMAELGTAFGSAISTVVFKRADERTDKLLGSSSSELPAFHAAFWSGAVMGFIGTFSIVQFCRSSLTVHRSLSYSHRRLPQRWDSQPRTTSSPSCRCRAEPPHNELLLCWSH